MATSGYGSSQTQEVTAQGVATTLSKKLRLELSKTEYTLTDTYQDIYNYSGVGYLIGFIINFDSNKSATKLIVDGETIFDLSNMDIESCQVNVNGNTPLGQGIGWSSNDKKLFFAQNFPLRYETSVVVQAKKSTGNSKVLCTIFDIIKE